jgi:hypothetical protein
MSILSWCTTKKGFEINFKRSHLTVDAHTSWITAQGNIQVLVVNKNDRQSTENKTDVHLEQLIDIL